MRSNEFSITKLERATSYNWVTRPLLSQNLILGKKWMNLYGSSRWKKIKTFFWHLNIILYYIYIYIYIHDYPDKSRLEVEKFQHCNEPCPFICSAYRDTQECCYFVVSTIRLKLLQVFRVSLFVSFVPQLESPSRRESTNYRVLRPSVSIV